MSDFAEITIERDFNATPDAVWELWTVPEKMSHWYGPNVETVFHQFDVTIGGGWHDEMRMKGQSMFGKAVFDEIKQTERLAWRHSSADKDGNVTANPMMPNFPRELKTVLTLTPIDDGQTKMALTISPINADADQEAAFIASDSALRAGWNAGFDLMEEMLGG